MTTIFWLSALFLFYTYIGYPLLMFLWAKFRPNPIMSESIEPTVTVVISAFNEQDRIVARIDNLLEQNYPADKLNIVVVSDGSTDSTVKNLNTINSDRVTVISLEENVGKSIAVSRGVSEATGEFIVFADVRQRFSPDAVRSLIEPFADHRIGATTGELILESSGADHEPEGVGLYWKYEKMIRDSESIVDSMVGATGAIYAIRRALYEPLPEGIILDDVLTPVRIARQNYRVCMVRNAIAYDTISGTYSEEFSRKVRTLAGNFQLMQVAPWINNPFKNRLFFQWISHKVCRLFSPYAMILLLISSFLIGETFYSFIGLLQLVVYAAAIAGLIAMAQGKKVKLVGTASSFLMLNITAVVGLYSILTGQTAGLWKKH
ncbi:MAG: glycosyltransferase family 2 protein [Gammaproteobacteria bacterium]